jgi:membrane protease YdiL (CAAX protease family)
MARAAVAWFFVLAFAGTWTLQFTYVALELPIESPFALALLTLAGVMPSLVAFVLARREGREATRRLWGPPGRAGAGLVALALIAPAILVLVTVALLLALGMPIPGVGLSAFALGAMIVASLGEELGWRGLAYQRLVEPLGAVRASVLVGALWGLWHLPTAFFEPDPSMVGLSVFVVLTTTGSVVLAWIMERAGRRTIVAIAFHAGTHLTLFELPRSPVLAVRVAVSIAAAALAAVALHRMGDQQRR